MDKTNKPSDSESQARFLSFSKDSVQEIHFFVAWFPGRCISVCSQLLKCLAVLFLIVGSEQEVRWFSYNEESHLFRYKYDTVKSSRNLPIHLLGYDAMKSTRCPRYPLDRRLCGSQNRSGRYGGVRILYPNRDSNLNPWSSSPLRSRCTDWATAALIF
jgi:hypothetical protein